MTKARRIKTTEQAADLRIGVLSARVHLLRLQRMLIDPTPANLKAVGDTEAEIKGTSFFHNRRTAEAYIRTLDNEASVMIDGATSYLRAKRDAPKAAGTGIKNGFH